VEHIGSQLNTSPGSGEFFLSMFFFAFFGLPGGSDVGSILSVNHFEDSPADPDPHGVSFGIGNHFNPSLIPHTDPGTQAVLDDRHHFLVNHFHPRGHTVFRYRNDLLVIHLYLGDHTVFRYLNLFFFRDRHTRGVLCHCRIKGKNDCDK